jgi:nucleoid-associated protein YgaU
VKKAEKVAPAGVDPDTLKSNEIARSVLGTGVKPTGFRVVYQHGVATLRGNVGTEAERQRVLTAARGNAGVREVKDELQVAAGGGVSASPSAASPSAGSSYTVKKGDTLSEIAQKHYGKASDYKKIFEANRDILSDPDKIQPGQVLKLP